MTHTSILSLILLKTFVVFYFIILLEFWCLMLMNFVLDLPIEKTVIMVYLFFVILLFVRPILIFIENKKKLADNLDKSELRRRKSWLWSLWCAKLLSAQ